MHCKRHGQLWFVDGELAPSTNPKEEKVTNHLHTLNCPNTSHTNATHPPTVLHCIITAHSRWPKSPRDALKAFLTFDVALNKVWHACFSSVPHYIERWLLSACDLPSKSVLWCSHLCTGCSYHGHRYSKTSLLSKSLAISACESVIA